MLEDLFDFVSFIGAAQGVLIGVFLFTKRGNHPATIALAAYVFLFSIGLLEPYVFKSFTGSLRIPLLSFLVASNFLYGPLLFLFVYYLTSREAHLRRKDMLHFLPFMGVWIAETLFSYMAPETLTHEITSLVAFEGLIIQMLTYNVKAIRRLKKSQTSPRFASDDIKWLQSLLIFITAIYVLSFLISHLILFGWQSAEELYLVVQLSITCMIYLMTYRLILQPGLFLMSSAEMGEQNGNGYQKYVRSGLKEEQAEEYLRHLNAHMEKEKPYLNPELSIYVLSQQLNISRNHLTQVINEKLNKNFYEFVNQFRVEEVKKKMQDPKYSHLNLTGIGLEAGFKSKTAFNINFKKVTGCTPTEWKRANAPSFDPKMSDRSGQD